MVFNSTKTLFLVCLTSVALSACSDEPFLPGDDSSSGTSSGQSSGNSDEDSGETGEGSGVDSGEHSSASASSTTSSSSTTTPAEVCPGPDAFEPNDMAAQAAPIALKDGVAVFSSGVSMDDADFFRFDAVKRDPYFIEAAYTPPAGDTSDLSLFVMTIAGTEVARHQEVRTGLAEAMTATWMAEAKGTPYAFKIESDSLTCMPVAIRISAQTCTDNYEDNDTSATAAKITLGEAGPTILSGTPTIYQGDDDFYEFVVTATDPVLVEATYTPPAGNESDLTLTVLDAVGQTVASDTRTREAPTETMSARFMPTAADALYRAKIESNDQSCVDYALQVNPRSCTDAFEDNESFETAKSLPAGQQAATVTKIDEDYFSIPPQGATGRCEISYTVAENNTEDLSAYLYGSSGTTNLIASHEVERNGDSEVMVLSWNAGDVPAYVQVVATQSSCTSYRIRCYSDT
jgi:hypothetical protein